MGVRSIGELDRRITIERKTLTSDQTGQRTASWSALATTYARVDYDSEQELTEAEQITATCTVIFTIRYRSVLPQDRILFDGTYYDIQGQPQIIGRRRFLRIRAEAKDATAND